MDDEPSHRRFSANPIRPFYVTESLVMLATIAQWLVLAAGAGALVGVGCTLFLKALFIGEANLAQRPWWLLALLLPAAGLFNGVLLRYGYRLRSHPLGDDPIVAVNEQQGRMPFSTIWVKPLAALVTLSCGGSAGKEGPCSHIGASVAAVVGRVLRLNGEMRRRLVACGVSAGFASVFGTPIAGAIYGVEMLAIGRVRHDYLFPAVVAGVTGFEVSKRLGLTWPAYRVPFGAQFSEVGFLKTVAVGIFCGAAAWLFVESLRWVEGLFAFLRERFRLWAPLMPTLGGVALALLVLVVPTDYLGLSLPVMERALSGEAVPWYGFLFKCLLVAVTLGSGFYGGVVTPQFVIGAVAGAGVAPVLGLPTEVGAAVGLVAVVAAASNAPMAAIFMGVELFGSAALLHVAGACVAAYLLIGHRSVYPEQQVAFSKSSWLSARIDQPVSQEKVRLSNGLVRWLARWRRKVRARLRLGARRRGETSPRR